MKTKFLSSLFIGLLAITSFLIPTSSNATNRPDWTLSAQLLDSSIDKAGTWGRFYSGEGAGGLGTDSPDDWNIEASLKLEKDKKIKSITLKQTNGEYWSTNNEDFFPLVVIDKGRGKLTDKYTNDLGNFSTDGYLWSIYAQKNTLNWIGGTLTVAFSDGTEAIATIAGRTSSLPAYCAKDTMLCSNGISVSRTGPSCQFVCPTYSVNPPKITNVAGKAAGNFEIDAGGSVGIMGAYLQGKGGSDVYIGDTVCPITYESVDLIYCTASSNLKIGNVYNLYVKAGDTKSNSVQVKVLSKVSTDTQKSIKVLSPNGGEIFNLGSSNLIRWSSQNLATNSQVAIDLINSDGVIVSSVANEIKNTGYYSWSIPSNFKWTENDYKILITSLPAGRGSVQDRSDYYFGISTQLPRVVTNPTNSITVSSPKNGEILAVGKKYSVKFKSGTNNFDYYTINLKNKYSGGVGIQIATNVSKYSKSYSFELTEGMVNGVVVNSQGKTAEQIKNDYYIEILAMKAVYLNSTGAFAGHSFDVSGQSGYFTVLSKNDTRSKKVNIELVRYSYPTYVYPNAVNQKLFDFKVSADSSDIALNGFAIGGNTGQLSSVLKNMRMYRDGKIISTGQSDGNNGHFVFQAPIFIPANSSHTYSIFADIKPNTTGQIELMLGGVLHNYDSKLFIDGMGFYVPNIKISNSNYNDSDVQSPYINKISPSSGPIGTNIEITGTALSGFEGDLDVIFERTDGKQITLTDYSNNYTKYLSSKINITLKEPCQEGQYVYRRYSGLLTKCDFVALTPGDYKVYVQPYNKKSNVINFKVTSTNTNSTITVLTPTNSYGSQSFKTGDTVKFEWSIPNMLGIRKITLIPVDSNGTKTTVVDTGETGFPIMYTYYNWKVPSTVPNGKYYVEIQRGDMETKMLGKSTGFITINNSTNDFTYCAQDMMQCSNGLWVSRTGPSCQFVCTDTTVSNQGVNKKVYSKTSTVRWGDKVTLTSPDGLFTKIKNTATIYNSSNSRVSSIGFTKSSDNKTIALQLPKVGNPIGNYTIKIVNGDGVELDPFNLYINELVTD